MGAPHMVTAADHEQRRPNVAAASCALGATQDMRMPWCPNESVAVVDRNGKSYTRSAGRFAVGPGRLSVTSQACEIPRFDLSDRM
ncbi:hypothetical protein CSUB01_00856 [Colletotrichum sublineola]|uniref:Uncharacterized protein n=1 Tax=Colletotrichum sublineola TaxID=1173701 RepID=A0A066X8V1_COLSU|nr:hypothetical protein CSUB01_00856 [Colletotrichum sublineola]